MAALTLNQNFNLETAPSVTSGIKKRRGLERPLPLPGGNTLGDAPGVGRGRDRGPIKTRRRPRPGCSGVGKLCRIQYDCRCLLAPVGLHRSTSGAHRSIKECATTVLGDVSICFCAIFLPQPTARQRPGKSKNRIQSFTGVYESRYFDGWEIRARPRPAGFHGWTTGPKEF
jgi:hypothetical protein